MSIFSPDSLKALIDEYVPDLVAIRRDLHEHPELAFEEVRTSGIVAQRLHALGLEVQTGIAKTGVVGLLRGGVAGPGAKTIAIRADMDALPIAELNEVEYRSRVEGKMHACGHDGHTAILLTVAALLSKRRSELAGNVKFLFQPAEESIGGAKPMVEQGAVQGVDAVIGLHLISDIPSGRVAVRAGAICASADDYVLTVTGRGGHAASPHEAVDPIVIGAQIIAALQTLISRSTSPFSPSVITIGEMKAGTTFNIIPETAVMRGTVRTFSSEHRTYLMRRIGEVASGIASTLGGSCEIEWQIGGCPPCSNDPAVTALVRRAVVATVGEEMLDEDESVVSAGSDDMAEFLQAVPGCYFMVGSGNEAKGTHYQHHHPRFDLDEDALPIGVEALVRAAVDYLEQG
ncbi:MAG: amidohydrolase [Ktedonobacteraceae bacterium]|nr:amidohydrolase [Ktedonobacteraceae bacterium]MBO0789629.1 amidohydrolase [Ktedonobacteraceae bacterium]